ncbi:MAG: zinc-binding dehydrogenase, partial [Erysipelotrichaceae bacterium]|nr:zinc-binding dehydrogenase [Erysipelotrichaceae bacterium]
TGRGFYKASLSEPISCIINAFQACFHNEDNGHVHKMGIKENGKVLIVGGCGPMGLGAIAYALVCPQHPSQIAVSDIDPDRIERARRVLPEQKAEEKGIELNYVNVRDTEDPAKLYSELSGGQGFDDVFVLAPETDAAQHAAQALGADGCLHFFAGPQQSEFIVPVNLYDVHYNTTHYVGTSGGTKEDMKQALELFADDQIDPAVMVSHIGGLDAVIETTKQLPALPGAKKLIYPHIQMPLTAIEDLKTLAQDNALFAALAQSVQEHNGLWNEQAERILLEQYGVNI